MIYEISRRFALLPHMPKLLIFCRKLFSNQCGTQTADGFLHQSFVQATGRKLIIGERAEMTNAVLKGMRWTYLGTGMTHPNFLATVEAIRPEAKQQIEQMAPAFC